MDQSASHFEFDETQNAVLGKAATWVGWFSWVLLGSAGIMALGGLLSHDETAIGALIEAAIYFLIGLNLRGAAAAMKSVVETSGNDIGHLMLALEKLASAFKVTTIVVVLGVILYVIATVALGNWMSSLPA